MTKTVARFLYRLTRYAVAVTLGLFALAALALLGLATAAIVATTRRS